MRARVWIATLSGATLAATVGLVGAGTLSTANATGPTAQPAGVLTLSTGAGTSTGDGWSFTKQGNSTGTPDSTQAVGAAVVGTTTTCNLTPTTGPLVSYTATNGTAVAAAGFAHHSIGVTEGTTNYACSQVNVNRTTTKVNTKYVTTTSNESLTVALNNATGGGLNDPEFGAFQATSATLDIEAGDDSKVVATTTLAGQPVGTFTLLADEDPTPATLPANTVYCQVADRGSYFDLAGKSDNCTWNIPGPNFDAITLTSVAGAFSLEGGGDWGTSAASHRTSFALVDFYDGTLATCDGTDSATTLGGGTVTGATLTRLVSGDPGQCAPVPYTLTTTDAGTTFHKPVVPGDTSQFSIALTRVYPSAPNPIPAAVVNWEDGNPLAPLPLSFCKPGLIASVDANNQPVGVNYSLLTGADDQSTNAGLQYACVYQQLPVYNLATGSVTMTDWIYFTGDVRFGGP